MVLLIVDDEYECVEGIRCSVDWASLGIDEICTAYSMKQAQTILQSKKVDIVLSDVEMPRGTGLDLLDWARKQEMDFISILVTGYAVFQYAKQAIELDCMDYLLKPVSLDELTAVLGRAVQMVLEKQLRVQNDARRLLWDSQRDLREESFWKMVVDGHHWASEAQIQEKIQAFSIDLKSGEQFLPIFLKLYTRVADWMAFGSQIENLTERYLLSEPDVMLVRESDLSCFVIRRCTGDFENNFFTMRMRCQEFVSAWEEISKIPVACYMGEFTPIFSLHDMCCQVKKLMEKHSGGHNAVVELRERQGGANDKVIEQLEAYIHSHLAQELGRQQLAEYVYLSPDYLARLFRQQKGVQLSEYIIRARMEKGRQLLEETDLPVSEVALAVGYVNPAYFIKVFRERYGVTPKKFREGK